MNIYFYLTLNSLLSCFLFAFARSFQSNSLWLVLGFLIYLLSGFLWNRIKIPRCRGVAVMALPILADAIFMQVISIRPNLLIMHIFAFLGLIIGLCFTKTFFHILVLLCLLLLNAFFVFYYFPNLAFKSNLKIDKRLLPEAVFVNSLADTLLTKDLEGKVVLIDMWYAKCGACFVQFNETEKIYQHFKNNPKVIVIGLNTGIDDFDVFLAANNLIRKKKNLHFPVWLDAEMSISKKLDLKEFPQNIIINSKGQICYIHKGFSRDEENIYSRKIINIIERLLVENR